MLLITVVCTGTIKAIYIIIGRNRPCDEKALASMKRGGNFLKPVNIREPVFRNNRSNVSDPDSTPTVYTIPTEKAI